MIWTIPDYVLYNKPLEGFGVTGVEHPAIVKQEFINAIHALDGMWAEIIWVACNTLHTFFPAIEETINAELVHMIHETCCAVEEYDNILVLCSDTTTKTQLYESYLTKTLHKKHVLTLDGKAQKKIDNVIEAVMGNNQWAQEIDTINQIIKQYQSQWPVDAVILGCTELPLAYWQSDCMLPLASSNTVLAKLLVEKARKQDCAV